MHITSLMLSIGLASTLAPAAVLAWAQDGAGVWVASNTWYARVGNYNNVHESCTRMNSQTVLLSGACAYWTNGQGGQGHGVCRQLSNQVACLSCNRDDWSKCNSKCNLQCLTPDTGIASCLAGCHNTCRIDAAC